MAVVAGAFKTVAITAAGPTQDITSADMGSELPKCAVIVCTLALTDAVAANGALMSVGIVADNAAGSRVCCSVSQNGVPASNSNNWQRAGSVILVLDPATGAIVAQANLQGFIAGGIRIAWDVVTYALPTAAFQIHGMFYGGTDLLAKVVTVTSDGVPLGGTTVNGVGFSLDAAIVIGATRGFDDVSRLHASVSLGLFVTDHGSPPDLQQCATVWMDPDNLNPTQELCRSVSDRVYQNLGTGGTGSGLEIISVGPDGFRTQDKDGTSSAYSVGVLCLKFGGAVQYGLMNFQAPTATGIQNIAEPFIIQAGIFLPSLAGTIGVTETGANAGATAIGFLSPTIEASCGVSANDAVTPSATRSRAHARVIEMPETDTTIGYRGDWQTSSATSGTLDINFTSVTATAAQVWALVIGRGGQSSTLSSVPIALFVPEPASLSVGIAFPLDAVRLAVYVPEPSLSVVSITPIAATLEPVVLAIGVPQRAVFLEAGVPSTFRGKMASAGIEAGQISTGGPVKGLISTGQP